MEDVNSEHLAGGDASVTEGEKKRGDVFAVVSESIKKLKTDPSLKVLAGQEVEVLLGKAYSCDLGMGIMIRTESGRELPILVQHLRTKNPVLIGFGAQPA